MKNNQKSSKSNRKKQQQAVTQMPDSGRSMIEMLGVLAVVGALSIAGIMGYTYAMKKYQANKVAAELNFLSNQIATILNQPHSDDFELSLGAPYDNGFLTSGNYAFSYGCGSDSTVKETCATDEYAYYAQLKNVPEEQCQTLAQTTQFLSYLTEQQINGESDTTGANCVDTETGNTLILFFETQEDEVEAIVTSSHSTSNTTTTKMMTTTGLLITRSTFPDVGECIDGFKGIRWDFNLRQNVAGCYSCSDTTHYIYSTETECKKCDNTPYKRGIGFDSQCQLCDELSDRKDYPNRIRTACAQCGRGVDWTNDWYIKCAPGTDDIYPPYFSEDTGWGECGENRFGSCYDCGTTNTPYVDQFECNRCDNSPYKRTYLPNGCYRCDTELIYDEKDYPNRIRTACAKCGRGVDWSNPNYNKCAPGADDIFSDNYNEESDWGTCGVGKFGDIYGYCYNCSNSSYVENVSEEECNLCDNSAYKRVTGSDGKCYRCDGIISDYKNQIRLTCNKCGRGVDWKQKNEYGENYFTCASGVYDNNTVIITTTPVQPLTTTTTAKTAITSKNN